MFEVSDFFEGEGGGVFVGEVEATAGAEGEGVQPGVVLFERLRGLMAEESSAEVIVWGEVGRGGEEGVELGEGGAEVGGVFGLGGGGDVRPAGRGVGAAKAGGPGGLAGHGVLPFFVKEGGKRRVGSGGRLDQGEQAAEEGGGGFHEGEDDLFSGGNQGKCGACATRALRLAVDHSTPPLRLQGDAQASARSDRTASITGTHSTSWLSG